MPAGDTVANGLRPGPERRGRGITKARRDESTKSEKTGQPMIPADRREPVLDRRFRPFVFS